MRARIVSFRKDIPSRATSVAYARMKFGVPETCTDIKIEWTIH